MNEAEIETLRAAIAEQWRDPAVAVTVTKAVTPAVERIVAARLAAVEALADEWETFPISGRECAKQLRRRAALAAVATAVVADPADTTR